MKHVKQILAKTLEHASKAKFYHNNQDIFLRYFPNLATYQKMILAGNFDKMERVIKENTTFTFEKFNCEAK
jgi:hypothetical protein